MPDLFLSFRYNTDTSGMAKTARKAKSIPLSLGCNQKHHAWWNTANPTGSGFSAQRDAFHNSTDPADSAEGGKPTSPSHTARAHCWLWAVQANMLRGTVTFPFPGTQVPPVRPYQAVSCSDNWQTSCCTCSLTPGLTAYTMAVAVSAQATSAWSCLWSKYKVLADRRKKANKPKPVWQVVVQLGSWPRFWEKILQGGKKKKEEKISENSSKISYENIIIKCKTGGIERKTKEPKYFLFPPLGLKPSTLALKKDQVSLQLSSKDADSKAQGKHLLQSSEPYFLLHNNCFFISPHNIIC